MKLIFTCFVFFMSQWLTQAAYAQPNKSTNILQPPPRNLVIDGDVKEWGDSLRYHNAEKKINYSLANDKDNLYVAIRINDRVDQLKVLRSGFTFSIDPKGKKRETYSITFPLNVQGTPAFDPRKEEAGEITKADREELMRARLTTLRGIKVEGFKDVEGDMITTSNTYGIQTAINYDESGNLICEAAIPLKFFHADAAKNEWAFNFKINGFTRPSTANRSTEREGNESRGGRGGGMGGGRGGHGGRGGSRTAENGEAGQGEMFKSSDFWEKFYLAN